MAYKGKRRVVMSARNLVRSFQHSFSLVAHQKKDRALQKTRAAKAIFSGGCTLFSFFKKLRIVEEISPFV